MNPQRIAIKFFTTPDTSLPVALEPFIPLFHAFIQRGRVEGLLIDVADYAHVPDGPGVLLVGHDVDYAIDSSAGRAGLLVTRKRCGDLSLAELLGDTLRKALVAVQAIEEDRPGDLRFDTDSFRLQILDRLVAPNNDQSFQVLQAEVEAVLVKLFGDAAFQLSREEGDDPRKALALRAAAQQPLSRTELIERLGGAQLSPVEGQGEGQSDWDISVEELQKLRDDAVDHLLLDVREPDEYEICNLGGRLIPLGSLEGELASLDRSAQIVVHCKTGTRSARATSTLRQAGFDNAWNLHRGILAWIERIDSSLTRY